jgi:L-aspartate oxidase
MIDVHPLAELAPRDVVARAIQHQMTIDGTNTVWLDLRHLDGPEMKTRFPTIARELAARGLDFTSDLIPVAPAAHYFMGGIVAGSSGETSLPGLFAIGEAACTGVHGANRLASNSLLEGLVFGLEAADNLNHYGPPPVTSALDSGQGSTLTAADDFDHDLADLKRTLQHAMSRFVAVVRDASGLIEATAVIADIEDKIPSAISRKRWEVVNMATVAKAIAEAARKREESRGAHFRTDFPELQESLASQHLILINWQDGEWRVGSLDEVREPALAGV